MLSGCSFEARVFQRRGRIYTCRSSSASSTRQTRGRPAQGGPEMDSSGAHPSITIPGALPVLVIRNRVLFPGGLLRLSVGKPRSIRLVEDFLFSQKRLDTAFTRPGQGFTPRAGALIGVFALRPGESEDGQVKAEEESAAVQEGEGAAGGVEASGMVPGGPPIYAVGCAAKVVQVARASTPEYFQFSILVQGVCRIRATAMVQLDPYYLATVHRVDDVGSLTDVKVQAPALNLREATQELIKAIRGRGGANPANGRSNNNSNNAFLPSIREVTESLQTASPSTLADVLIAHLNIPLEEKQAVLEERGLEARLMKALELIKEQVEVISLSSKITSEVEGKLTSRQREAYLRQQLKAIREELGDEEEGAEEDELAELANKVKKAELPDEVRAVADKEIRRLKKMQPSQPEYTVLRNYMDWLVDMPWSVKEDEERMGGVDVTAVEQALERDHYGLAKVKRRIVEYMAVRALKKNLKGPILCLVGPPGVGKTSLGRSIAQALNRKFQRLSLGGVHDEAEIRGHRRTYIGAMPGSIVQSIKKAGSRSCVLLLDEIDKLGVSMRGGDPAAALLEVLDPEQNSTFTDHYLNVPFDLSGVFFLATANQTDTIPEPLLDRMEVIQLPGYTLDEKAHIARQYLIPKQLEANGLEERHLTVTPGAIARIANGYTREAGVRQVERELAAVCRHVALRLAMAHGPISSAPKPVEQDAAAAATDGAEQQQEQLQLQRKEEPHFPRVVVTADMLTDILGPVKYESEVAARTGVPGVCTGLAWKPSGGELLFIECSTVPGGKGVLTITGKLGDVMKESASIALSWIRAKATDITHLVGPLRQELNSTTDVHIHVPAGAIPKDGPSAGVAIAVALVSLVTGRRIHPSLAMTGEVTLRGLVLPVGGIKEKVLAAHRGGITHVVLPERNAKDLNDLPPRVRQDLKFTLARSLTDVLEVAFEPHDEDGTDAARHHVLSEGTGPLAWPHHHRPTPAVAQPCFTAVPPTASMLMDRCGPVHRSLL